MSRDHIIPQFILRGFAINPSENKKKQTIMVYDKGTDQEFIELIGNAFAVENFNTKENEQFLAQKYETDVARLFRDIKKCINTGETDVSFSESDYKLLIRFFVIMWRRNDIQMQKAKEMTIQIEMTLKSIFGDMYTNMKKPEYKDSSLKDIFEQHQDDIRNTFYTHAIQNTTDDDETVKKTIENYSFVVAYNKSNVHFIMHNLYATLLYFVNRNNPVVTSFNNPAIMIYPISKTICIYGLRGDAIVKKDNNIILPIEIWENDDKVKELFIDRYMIKTAVRYVVDETNISIVKNNIKK